ncbi:hypothetical protein F5Y19DRAFT_7290 [Xylariaceae sp. FL1651]|nr:hypothetical protein F5Y19DRAFT_7290 [Xylariaceae sp. FL1651]
MDRFRKQRDKLISRLAKEAKDELRIEELTIESSTNSRTGNVVQIQSPKQRALEPLIRHHSKGTSTLDPKDTKTSEVHIERHHTLFSRTSGAGHGSTDASVTSSPLGLTLVHTLPNPVVDLIFVHGLGGSSRGTWSWKHDTSNFWPLWLRNDSELSRARVFTYGYDAGFTGPYTTSSILDFAKDLLLRINTWSGDDGIPTPPPGQLPIVFVAHSMGGLVVKRAYIIGKTDPNFNNIVASIAGIVFLATPHKGSQLAQTLNSILRTSPTSSTKTYVAELEKNSSSLQDINEQFRNLCGTLELVSFYETAKTSLGAGIKRLIVEKESAVLEYPGETSCALVADHHNMAKFQSPLDANFTNVRNVLRWLVKRVVPNRALQSTAMSGTDGLTSKQHPAPPHVTSSSQPSKPQPFPEPNSLNTPLSTETYIEKLTEILGVSERDYEDIDSISERMMDGSCRWLLQRQKFQDWATNSPASTGLLWITGAPGSGKSTLSSFIINFLSQSHSGLCQYHFFFAGHQTKRTISFLLRSVAFQAAVNVNDILSQIVKLHESTGITFGDQKVSIIWEKLFEGLLFRSSAHDYLYWVFDGLDEAESAPELIKLVSKIRSAARVNVLLVSRSTKELSKEVLGHLPNIAHERISIHDTADDIRDYVRQSITRALPDNGSQEEIIREIMNKSMGSFLWVKLVLEKIRDNWYTKSDIQKALNDLPVGMEPLYDNMSLAILGQPEKIRVMASRILTWAVCSFHPLNIDALEVALRPEYTDFVNLARTAEEICGQFITVNKMKLSLIHQTARQFLLRRKDVTSFGIAENDGHTYAANVCMDYLSDAITWHRVFSTASVSHRRYSFADSQEIFAPHPFLSYALSFWSYHVSLASADSDEFLGIVLSFLEEHCLLWMHGAALTKDLRILTRAARNLKAFARRRAKSALKRPTSSSSASCDEALRHWATDIIRIVARFGTNIAESPTSIYKVIPFCPKDSIISKTFYSAGQSVFVVRGLSSAYWDNCLARLSVGDEQMAAKIICKDTFFITLLAMGGIIIVWRAETCEEIRRLTHGEYVATMASSMTSNLLATAGFQTIRIWDIAAGSELYQFPKEPHHHVRAMAFGKKDEDILVAYDDCVVKCLDLRTGSEKWRFVARELNSNYFSCARYMVFSPDLSQIAVIFRGRPALSWDVLKSQNQYAPPKRCVLVEDRLRAMAEGEAWNAPEIALWHPTTSHLLILYEDTRIVEWNIADDEQISYDHTAARSMTVSQDGSYLLTSDVTGALSVWAFPDYRLAYRMKYDEPVTDLAFSPDGSRLYDLRGPFCNVWEPDVLIMSEDADHDMSSAYETRTSEPVLAKDENSRVPVTALACDSSDRHFCVGKEDGSVTICSMPHGQKVRKVTSHSSSVSVLKISWSASEKYLASVDDSGRVIVKRLEPPTAGKDRWAVFPVCDVRMEDDDVVETLLFSQREDFLLIVGSTHARVINMKTKKGTCRVAGSTFKGKGIWLNHPQSASTLIHVSSNSECLYQWKNFQPKQEIPIETSSATEWMEAIEQGIEMREQYLVLSVLSGRGGKHRIEERNIELVDLTRLGNPASPTPTGQRKRVVVDGLKEHVRYLVGCYQDRVVFLDSQFWLCTWEMEAVYSKHKRHFFLPKDWINTSALKLVTLTAHGTLLCPKNGEVAVIKSGFK